MRIRVTFDSRPRLRPATQAATEVTSLVSGEM